MNTIYIAIAIYQNIIKYLYTIQFKITINHKNKSIRLIDYDKNDPIQFNNEKFEL